MLKEIIKRLFVNKAVLSKVADKIRVSTILPFKSAGTAAGEFDRYSRPGKVREVVGSLVLVLVMMVILSACLPEDVSGPDPCNEGGTLLNDDFEGTKNCGWVLYDRSGAAAQISDGVLRLSTSQPGQIWWTNAERDMDDTIVTVQARQVGGPNDNAYGIICRYTDPENFYVFLISGDGFYAIGKYESGSEQIVYLTGGGQYTFSNVINQGAAVNEIRASCIGSELSLTVNGIPVETVSDSTFTLGDIGLAASTFQPGTAVIQFDNVQVIAP